MADFIIYRGDTPTFNVAVTWGGEVFPLTGCSMWFTAKYAYADDDADAVFQKTIGDGITVTNAGCGEAEITLSSSDTSSLSSSKVMLVYDLQIRNAEGKIYTVAYGNIVVLPDVTRSVS